jgi:release factor glutamine methyltransferase
LEKLHDMPLDVLHTQEGVAVVHKQSGVRKRDLEEACRVRLFDGAQRDALHFLYQLEKGLSGVVVVVVGLTRLLDLRGALRDGHLTPFYSCLVSGRVGAGGSDARTDSSISSNNDDDDGADTAEGAVVMPTTHPTWPAVPAAVVRCVQSRKADHITHITVPVDFPASFDGASWQRPDKTAADFEALRYPTVRIKSVRRALQLGGHTVVGDGGAVKSAKGLYASVTRVRFAGTAANAPFDVSVPVPRKFAALLDKEQFMHDLAKSKHAALVDAWAARHAAEHAGAEGRRAAAGDGEDDGDEDDGAGSEGSDDVPGAGRSLEDMQAMLAAGVPVEYILGEALFCGLRLAVTPDVMVPKRSSEVLVAAAVAAVEASAARHGHGHKHGGRGVRVLDLGTGSGCLLLGVLHRLLLPRLHREPEPHAQPARRVAGLGTDISAPALAVAARNAASLGLHDAAAFRVLDFANLIPLLEPPEEEGQDGDTHPLCGPFDVIVCNPPYSSRREGRLSVAATDHEPALALFALDAAGHPTGPLGAYRTIAQALRAADDEARRRARGQNPPRGLLTPRGRLVLEVGVGQDVAVRGIIDNLCGAFLQPAGSRKDHKGIVRCLEWEYVPSSAPDDFT